MTEFNAVVGVHQKRLKVSTEKTLFSPLFNISNPSSLTYDGQYYKLSQSALQSPCPCPSSTLHFRGSTPKMQPMELTRSAQNSSNRKLPRSDHPARDGSQTAKFLEKFNEEWKHQEDSSAERRHKGIETLWRHILWRDETSLRCHIFWTFYPYPDL